MPFVLLVGLGGDFSAKKLKFLWMFRRGSNTALWRGIPERPNWSVCRSSHRCRFARASFKREKELSPFGTMADLGLGQAYLALGDYDKAVTSLSTSATPAAINYFFLSEAYAARGDKQEALATLQKSLDMGFRDFAVLDASPYFASLRADSHFQAMMQKYKK